MPELFVAALEPSVENVEQAVHATDVVKKVVVRGMCLQEVVFNRVVTPLTLGSRNDIRGALKAIDGVRDAVVPRIPG